jgi:TusA-related sulfurtransferase
MIPSDNTLDTLGLFCPLPIILTSKKIKEMQVGEVLEVLSDDIGIKKDMPIWCRDSGNDLIHLSEERALFKCYIRKNK